MDRNMLGNSWFAAARIANEERLQAMREAARQARLIRESGIPSGRDSVRRVATVRRNIGSALIRAGERLGGAPAVAAQPSTLSANG